MTVISGLTAASLPISAQDLLIVDQVNPLSPSGFSTRKVTAGNVTGKPTQLGTIAALRSVTLSAQVLRVQMYGYYAQGDGGGGSYYYDSADTTSSDNGGTVIVSADDARWKLVTQGVYSVKQFGAKTDGTDASTSILSCISAMVAAGPGTVMFPPGAYTHGITIPWNTSIKLLGPGATLTYTGSGVQIQTPTTGYTAYAKIEGLTLNFGNAATVLQLNSAMRCSVEDVTFIGTSYTNTLMQLTVNSTGSMNPAANYNCVFNYFKNVFCEAICGRFVQLQGSGPAGGPATSVVTLNTFDHVTCDGPPFGACIIGWDFNQWADTNQVIGHSRINLPAISQAINSFGMVQNSQGPTQNYGVYNNSFTDFAVDTFGTVASDNRVGFQLNFSAQTKLSKFYQYPVAAGGSHIIGENCYSYELTFADGSNNLLRQNFFGSNVGIGASHNTSYSLYLSSFTLTGSSQVSINVADTYSSAATGAVSGIVLNPATQATSFTMTSYFGLNIANISKGAGSSITANAAIYIQDQTSGAQNYGIYMNVSSGGSKYNIYAPGTATNYFAGDMLIAGGAQAMLHTLAAVTSGSGANTGTLTNSPVTGNPTKWIPFNDAGTTRYIPAW